MKPRLSLDLDALADRLGAKPDDLAQHTALLAAVYEAARQGTRDAIEDLLRDELATIQARATLGDDLPLDHRAAAALLPFSERTLSRLRRRRRFRMMRLHGVGRPYTTVGAIRALIRKGKPE